MFHLIYLSSATSLFDRQELSDLLTESRRNNERDGVTGILVYKEGNFLQAIEGEEAIVKALFSKSPKILGIRGYSYFSTKRFPSASFQTGQWLSTMEKVRRTFLEASTHF